MKSINELTCTGGLYLAALLSYIPSSAQEPAFHVKEKSAERVGENLCLRLTIDVSGMKLASGRSVLYTPMIEAGDSTRALPPILLNGRTRDILYERTERAAFRPVKEFAYRRFNGKEQCIEYQVETLYADWMKRAEVSLMIDTCGCGWERSGANRADLLTLNFAEPVVLNPVLAYVTPQAEQVKARKLEGSAFLDFPVNRTEIHPDYRNNPAELAKIRQTIDAVRNDPYATITGISIKGYASPEGSYKANRFLAEGRAKALIAYVRSLYDLGDARLSVDFEPEDWKGLERAIGQSDLPDRAELLAIVRADEPKDWDAREWKLKNLNGGNSYRILLREIYPSLRHSDYEVDYQIRRFTADEARELVFSDPSKLSLNEMFLAAQSYGADSREFGEIFETAVRLYPEDPVSNLNAATTAIRDRRLADAKRYLAKASDMPERQLALAAIAMLEDRLDDAERLLMPLITNVSLSAQAEENLKQIRAKRDAE